MKKVVLLINGAATSGKDLFIDSLTGEYFVIKTSIIDPVKDIAKDIGWTGKKSNVERKFLSDLKDLLDNYNGFSFWRTIGYVDGRLHASRLFSEYYKDPALICIITREPEDIKNFKVFYRSQDTPVYSILIQRKEAEQNIPNNHADQNVHNYDYDLTIPNNESIEKFKKTAISTIEEILKWENMT